MVLPNCVLKLTARSAVCSIVRLSAAVPQLNAVRYAGRRLRVLVNGGLGRDVV